MTKKNKPASLTSSLLARKGEAEPAEARPYLVPEAPIAGATQSGNDNGGNDGDAVSGNGGNKDLFGLGNFPLPELSEKSLRSTELEAADALPVPPASPADPAPPALNVSEPAPQLPSAAEPATPSMDIAEPAAGPSVDPTPDPQITDAEQETVRDARLLKFVYVMAALTGIMAIVIYSGGWFIDDGAQKTAKQDAPWTLPARTAAKSEDAADRPAEGAPEKAVTDNQPASATTAGSEKPADQSTKAPAEPEKPMAAAAPTLPASSRVLREGAGSASNPAATDIGSASPGATATAGEPADQSSTSAVASAPSAPEDRAAATAADRQPSAVNDPSASGMSAASSGISADTPAHSGQAVMTDKVPGGAGESASAPAAAVQRATPKKMASESAGTAPKETASSRAAQTEQAAAEKAPVAMVPPSGDAAPLAKPTGRFLIQLSSVKSQERANREWARLKKSFPKELGNLELIIEKRAIASRGTFYRVQTGRFETISEARAICAVLAAKKQGCLPIKR